MEMGMIWNYLRGHSTVFFGQVKIDSANCQGFFFLIYILIFKKEEMNYNYR